MQLRQNLSALFEKEKLWLLHTKSNVSIKQTATTLTNGFTALGASTLMERDGKFHNPMQSRALNAAIGNSTFLSAGTPSGLSLQSVLMAINT